MSSNIDESETMTPGERLSRLLRAPLVGPLGALILAVIIFSVITDTFLTTATISLVLQQTIVIGTLVLGQTLIILTSGIDLANGAIVVLGTIFMARYVVTGGNPIIAVLLGIAITTATGALNGVLVTKVKLPPFVVTLGGFTALFAVARLYSGSHSYEVQGELLPALGDGFSIGGAQITWGTLLLLGLFLLFWYLLSSTAWGRHVYAIGGAREAARLNGVRVGRVEFSVYVVAGILYGLAAWQSLGRIPNADPNAYQMGNLESITAVVIGGTSLFGGRGSVIGSLVGALIVGVLRTGLTQVGVNDQYQNVAVGVLVIIAVAIDQLSRGRSR